MLVFSLSTTCQAGQPYNVVATMVHYKKPILVNILQTKICTATIYDQI